MPAGLSGLLLAGILAAAMSTLSSSLSALSSSTVTDVVGKLRRTPLTDQQGLRVGRWATIGWGLAFIAPATIFRSDEGSIVVLALGVAGITYGGLLGAFVFGIVNKRARAADANIAFVIAVAINAFFFVMEKYVIGEVWVAWQWYPAARRHRHVRGGWALSAARRSCAGGAGDDREPLRREAGRSVLLRLASGDEPALGGAELFG